MPVSPLDLQTLFTQMDKVGREQSLQKEGAAIQQSVQGAVAAKRNEEQARTVKSTHSAEDDERKLQVDTEEPGASSGQGGSGSADQEAEGQGGAEGKEVIKDPGLGLRVDLSG